MTVDFRPAVGTWWVRRNRNGSASNYVVRELHDDRTVTLEIKATSNPDENWPGDYKIVRWSDIGWRVYFDEVA